MKNISFRYMDSDDSWETINKKIWIISDLILINHGYISIEEPSAFSTQDNWFDMIFEFQADNDLVVDGIVGKKTKALIDKKVEEALKWYRVDWEDMDSDLTPNFTVGEALFLPSFRVYHKPSNQEKREIIKTAYVMEKLRSIENKGISIHCWMRPLITNAPGSRWNGWNYNKYIGSTSKKSAHIFGKGVDFHVVGRRTHKKCAEVREWYKPYLEFLDIRMEDITGGWIHIDTNPVRNKRFFKP